MKLVIDKAAFLKSWTLAERNVASAGGMNVLCAVRVKADENGVELYATDVRTSIICRVQGVAVLEAGEAIFPVKGVGDLFRKAATKEFTLQVEEGKATLVAGKSRSRFSTFPAVDFPDIPTSASASLFCKIQSKELVELLERGTLAASQTEEFPLYLSSAWFEVQGENLKIVATDNRRLSLGLGSVQEGSQGGALLLPMKGIKDLVRVLGVFSSETVLDILFDDSQVYFAAEGVEFAVRRVESRFPPYEKILPKSASTHLVIDRLELFSALDRLDVVVRDYNRTVVLDLKPWGDCIMTAWAPEFGRAVEEISCSIDGDPLKIGVNSRYFMEGMKVISDSMVDISFNGQDGHLAIRKVNSDDYLCLLAPVELDKEVLEMQGDAL